MKIIKVALVIGLLVLSLAFYFQNKRILQTNPRFQIPAKYSLAKSAELPVFESQIINQPAYLPAAHSATLTKLANGDLLALWFAGTKEGNPDVKIWQSTYHDGQWSLATIVLDPQMVTKANHRYVAKIGNPVVYLAQNGILHLFVVSVSIGGWSGSSINHLQSKDNGKTWSSPIRLINSPFFNLSTLIRTSAVSLDDGGFYLPVYHEFLRKYPIMLRFDKNGQFISQQQINDINKMIQPSIMPISPESAWAYFRNANKPDHERPLFMAQTLNGGKTWSKLLKTNLTNPDSSLVSANLGDHKYLMVYNSNNRSQLMLAISSDGLNWQQIYMLEDQIDREYSYPAIIVDNNFIDILYTDNRKKIKHVRFNRAWLSSKVLPYVK